MLFFTITLQKKGAAFITVVGLLMSCVAGAEYRDPIDLPATKSNLAQSALHIDIAVTKDRIISVGERGIILVSKDGGTIWHQASVPTSAHLNAVYFLNNQIGWVVGEDQIILKTVDGGLTWSYLFDARNAKLKGPLLDVRFKNENEGFAIGVFNTLLRTVDGGQNWEDWRSHIDNLDEWHLFSITSSTHGRLYISSEAGLVFFSADHGQTFQALSTGHEGSLHNLLVKENPDGMDTVLALGVGGVLLRSNNSGASWQKIETGTQVGLSSGTWIGTDVALITLADGSFLRVDLINNEARVILSESGLPLSSVEVLQDNKLVVTGLAGVEVLSNVAFDIKEEQL